MLNRTSLSGNNKSYSAFNNQNASKTHIYQENESIKCKLEKHEQMLADIVRELKQKVNKSEFLSGLGSKVSLSDMTNFSFQNNSRDQSLRLDQSLSKVSKGFQQKIANYKESHESEIQKVNLKLVQFQNQLKEQIVSLKKQHKNRQEQLKAIMQEQNQSLLKIFEKKGDRSQLDKMMHLTSLLAIQFELIKKRFNNFEVDYNLIWKEISNIYQAQEGIKTALEIQQNNLNSFNNTLQKQSKKSLKKRKNSACVTNLFKELMGSVQRESRAIDECQELGTNKLEKQLQHLKNEQQNSNYSLKILSERLILLQNKQEQNSMSFTQLIKTKKQFQAAKNDIETIYENYQTWKEQKENISQAKMLNEIHLKTNQVKSQIKQIHQELSQKLIKMIQKYAKQEELKDLKQNIRLLQKKLLQKTDHLQFIAKKYQEDFSVKNDYLQDKVSLIQKQVSLRMKESEFLTQKTLLLSNKDAQALMKKTQNTIKKDLSTFQNQQKQINEVLCAQNVIARWIWVSRQLKGGNLIAWDKEVVNTLPENFNYSKNQYCIKIRNCGIYRFQIGFYAKKKPNIQILVNGQTVISAINSNSYVVHHSSGRLKDISTAEITGLTYYDFFTFQEDSRIAIAYNGDLGHGFISLQRL